MISTRRPLSAGGGYYCSLCHEWRWAGRRLRSHPCASCRSDARTRAARVMREHGATLREIAREFGVSRQRVQQILQHRRPQRVLAPTR